MALEKVAADPQRGWHEALASQVIDSVLHVLFPGKAALVSSFGADSAVMMHLVAQVDPVTPVLFIDTGRHFRETIEYRDQIIAHLGLSDVRSIGPSDDEAKQLDPDTNLALRDPDGCCAFRKVAPLERALREFDAWISGRKRNQAASRSNLPVFEADGRLMKINPLASWSSANITEYLTRHGLPRHPLVAQGYPSIGCAPCTSVVQAGEDARAGRWRNFDKTECGIHLSKNIPMRM